ncbi:response regulator transcription factor [Burkholderia cenocepacia]|uniref:response regulator transcription factor n=1 Tax=Burkholderia cenocepacia TaxID=95486 RepID=UPI002AC32690|nr:response regulator transcription factor [Burkholderia cenocepacia]
MKSTVIIADKQPIVITGLRHALNKSDYVVVAGAAKDLAELLLLLRTIDSDILVTDYSILGSDHREVRETLSFMRLRYPELKTIVFTTPSNARLAQRFLDHGVDVVIEKSRDIRHLQECVDSICRSKCARFSRESSSTLAQEGSNYSAYKKLSPREMETIKLYASGLTINEIASLVHRSKKTISGHKMNAMRKLGIKRNIDLLQLDFAAQEMNGEMWDK